jgi:Chaperone of endosialidase
MKKNTLSLTLVSLLTGFACLHPSKAVVPPPDGGYPNFTTAEGTDALKNLTTGAANTAVGWFSLFGDTTASFNTGVGAGTLLFNNGNENTAVGGAALLSNTTGSFNTGTGVNALSSNTIGVSNTAFGWGALLSNETGSNNTAIGVRAGQNITGNSNICIGSQVSGVQGENNTIRIGDNLPTGIGQASCLIGGIVSNVCAGDGTIVYINPANQRLCVAVSSERFKKDIVSIDKASEAIFSLNPVTFHYKSDDTGTPQFGLIAEDVAKVNRALITVDQEGKPFTVRYEQINAMLLNEFLKEHRKNEEQEATIARQQEQIEALTAGLQKVSAQLELSKTETQTVFNSK